MSPLMTKPLSEAADTTCNDNSDLIYLLNATVFDYITMKWAVMARM